MLKNIPANLSPDLWKVLMEMGHGDEIVLADGNFPSSQLANRLIRMDTVGTLELLETILTYFPLDTYATAALILMKPVNDDKEPGIWDDFKQLLIDKNSENQFIELEERFDFYERSKKSYAIVATGETAVYANIILKKWVVVHHQNKEEVKHDKLSSNRYSADN